HPLDDFHRCDRRAALRCGRGTPDGPSTAEKPLQWLQPHPGLAGVVHAALTTRAACGRKLTGQRSMATAGSIVGDRLMRTGAFETDTKRAEKRLQDFQKRASQVGKAIGAAFAVGATVIAIQLKNTIDRMDDLTKAAARASLPVEEFTK